jgi:hypothetical protein
MSPIGDVIKKYEKKWLEAASKSIITLFGLPQEQALMLAELILTLRLGFAHRFATAAKPGEARERGEKTFGFIHELLSGFSG